MSLCQIDWREWRLYLPFFLAMLLKAGYAGICSDWTEHLSVFGGVYGQIMSALCEAPYLITAICAISMLPGRLRVPAVILLDVLFSLLLQTDIMHMRYYSGQAASMSELKFAGQLQHVAGSLPHLASPWDILLWLDIPVLIAAICRFRSKLAFAPSFCRPRLYAVGLFMGFALILFGEAYRDYKEDLHYISRYDSRIIISRHGIITYHIHDAAISGHAHGYIEKARNMKFSKAEADMLLKPLCKSAYTGAGKGLNLIVIQTEALDGLILGMKHQGMEVSPRLNMLAQNSVYVPRVIQQTFGGGSSDAEFMINTGLYPLAADAAFFACAETKFSRSLSNLLKEEGYTSYAFHSDKKDFWNRDKMYKAMGFAKFYSQEDYVQDGLIGLGLPDASFFRQSLEKIRKLEDSPIYAYLITLSSHTPYSFPGKTDFPKETRIFPHGGGDDMDDYITDYLNAMRYEDRCIGGFIDGLEEAGLLEKSVVVITGDHSGMSDKKSWDRFVKLAGAKGRNVRLRHVPLIIMLPDQKHAKLDIPIGQIDIYAVIADIMGLNNVKSLGRTLGSPEHTVLLRAGNLKAAGKDERPMTSDDIRAFELSDYISTGGTACFR